MHRSNFHPPLGKLHFSQSSSLHNPEMPGLLPSPDPDGLLEYSVVYTDRALNHMSVSFQGVMKDLSKAMKHVYKAHSVAIIPGSGTYGMESVARQFATGNHVMVLRNGWFSYRWTQIFEAGKIPSSCTVLKAKRVGSGDTAPFAPAALDEVIATIKRERPAAVFAPHVETSAGIILPDSYIKAVAEATHEVGGLFVLDCIASGCVWIDMQELGVDVLISAPQKGWTGPACCAMVMLSEKAAAAASTSKSTSFTMDLGTWVKVMATYEAGKHMYHATMPTDALRAFRDVVHESEEYGFAKLKQQQLQLGSELRQLLHGKYGFQSVAAPGFQAPGVVVAYTSDPAFKSGAGGADRGGVPLALEEGAGYSAFRVGLFGKDKLASIPRTVSYLDQTLHKLLAKPRSRL